MDVKFSVIIPVYNEERSISKLCYSLSKVMNGLGEKYEVLIIDDGSTDTTVTQARRLQEKNSDISIIILEKRYGKSEALQAGFDNASGDIIITLDGDGQDDPRGIPNLLKKMEEGPDVVVGWRYNRRDSKIKKFSSKIANIFRRINLKDTIHDVGCPLRVFKRSCIKDVCLSRGLHRFFSTIMKKFGYRVEEIKVNHFPRQGGRSKYGIFNRLSEGVFDCCRIAFLDIHKVMRHKRQYQVKEIIRVDRNKTGTISLKTSSSFSIKASN